MPYCSVLLCFILFFQNTGVAYSSGSCTAKNTCGYSLEKYVVLYFINSGMPTRYVEYIAKKSLVSEIHKEILYVCLLVCNKQVYYTHWHVYYNHRSKSRSFRRAESTLSCVYYKSAHNFCCHSVTMNYYWGHLVNVQDITHRNTCFSL